MLKQAAVAALILLAALAAPLASAQSRVTLTARVLSESGEPVPDATVFVWTARPKEGPTIFCPSCYLDCGKQAVSDASGAVTIDSLDPTLLFNLMTVADGFTPQESGMLDPAAGAVAIELGPRPPVPDQPGHLVRAQVTDANGRPVRRAVVEPRTFWFPRKEGARGMSGTSRVDGADSLAITDDQGWFSLQSPRPIAALDIRVEARAHATRHVPGLLPDEPEQTVILTEGATIAGRLLDASGNPMAGFGVGMCQTDHSADVFVGYYEIDTDSQGRFSFVNMPPNQQCVVFTKMHSVGELGAAEPVFLTTGDDGSITGGVDLRLQPGHTLRGRVVLEDGKPIPEGKAVMLVGGNTIWDSAPEYLLPPNGAFEFNNLPTESYTISVRVPGYSISPRNPNCISFDGRIEGRIEHDIDGFIIYLQKGPFQRLQPAPPAQRPLQSYEGPLPTNN